MDSASTIAVRDVGQTSVSSNEETLLPMVRALILEFPQDWTCGPNKTNPFGFPFDGRRYRQSAHHPTATGDGHRRRAQ
jgi:hypothetical protein